MNKKEKNTKQNLFAKIFSNHYVRKYNIILFVIVFILFCIGMGRL